MSSRLEDIFNLESSWLCEHSDGDWQWQESEELTNELGAFSSQIPEFSELTHPANCPLAHLFTERCLHTSRLWPRELTGHFTIRTLRLTLTFLVLCTMVFSSTTFILGVAALASAYLAAPAAAADEPLPWDGRVFDLTVDTLPDKYLTHILTMRNNGTDGKVSDYVSIEKDGRSPGYNGDTGVINIGVDAKAIFKTQNNFRRSELVQNIAANTKGTTFFRTSVMKEEAFLNPYAWQMIFPESHIFEIRVDASASPAKIIYLNNGTWDAKWETEFVPGTWYNFGIGISAATSGNGSVLEFYTSEGDKELALEATHDVVTEFPSTYEFHYGLLTLSDDGSEPKMNAKQDIVSYNGVSVEADVSTSATGDAASKASKTTGSIGAESSSDVSTETTEAPTTQNETPATQNEIPATKTGIVKSSDSGCARK
ncbi:Glycoside hydrolase catalytic N-terminal domain-containing protein [Phytophthora infestans]|uniref:Glycoside hydrolase catalytic N-terminal domain-containing protein n=1 Tax=Phytophthora infestans TaxID=4787 RepID=A0A8S9UZV8_PHYIN|nr:Glycoside hydrolase catalytic N-terminal domain-containing protein [Phytophthora infestans]